MTEIVTKKIREFLKDEVLIKFIKALEGDINDIPEESLKKMIDSLMTPENRVFYEFYDRNGIEMGIFPNQGKFNYIINMNYSDLYNSRQEAEIKGFEKCAELLNEKLCSMES